MLWLWYRLAATAPIGSLTWEHPYAAGVALKSKKTKTKTKPTIYTQKQGRKEHKHITREDYQTASKANERRKEHGRTTKTTRKQIIK